MAWAPDNADGLHPYVITKTSWGRSYDLIEYAPDLRTAKQQFGWTRELHTRVQVRRARAEDLSAPRA